jgi:outer membrane protein OmpA-like peptidoglycan-associated protein
MPLSIGFIIKLRPMKTRMIMPVLLMPVLFAVSFKWHEPEIRRVPSVKLGKTSGLSIADLTKNVEYDFCKATIRAGSAEQIDRLAAYLKDGKHAISLRGHADALGTYVGNWKMSDKRAVTVKQQLIDKGVDSALIVTTPYGDTMPIASNKTAVGSQKNRRVEIVLREVKPQ